MRRLASRRGNKRAIVAIVAIGHDLGEDFCDVNRLPHLKRYFTKRLERLGFNVHITPAESTA